MNGTADLLDVNVWLAFAHDAHPHHRQALKCWPLLALPTFCRMTQISFLRLLCNAKVMGTETCSPEKAWRLYETLILQHTAIYRVEPEGLEEQWRILFHGKSPARDLWTDAYLAAFALCAGLRLVTFDRDFEKFKGLNCLMLSSDF